MHYILFHRNSKHKFVLYSNVLLTLHTSHDKVYDTCRHFFLDEKVSKKSGLHAASLRGFKTLGGIFYAPAQTNSITYLPLLYLNFLTHFLQGWEGAFAKHWGYYFKCQRDKNRHISFGLYVKLTNVMRSFLSVWMTDKS